MRRQCSLGLIPLLLTGACTSHAAHGSPSDRSLGVAVAEAHAPPVHEPLLGEDRRWMVEVQTALRWACDLAEVLDHWWRTDELARLHGHLVDADGILTAFVARSGLPRLATDWSPVGDPDHDLARRYDRMMRRALLSADDAALEVRSATAWVTTVLANGDMTHPAVPSLVTALEGALQSTQAPPSTTSPS